MLFERLLSLLANVVQVGSLIFVVVTFYKAKADLGYFLLDAKAFPQMAGQHDGGQVLLPPWPVAARRIIQLGQPVVTVGLQPVTSCGRFLRPAGVLSSH